MENKEKIILIAEDDESLSEIYDIEFKKNWYLVYLAKNWNEVVSKIQEIVPDIILLDLMMPFLDWFETLEIIRDKLPKQVKIIMFSSLWNVDNMIEARKLGVDDFIVKTSVTPKQLVEKINSYINN